MEVIFSDICIEEENEKSKHKYSVCDKCLRKLQYQNRASADNDENIV